MPISSRKSALTFLAHRGLWREPTERNSLDACERALKLGYGIEIDIRDREGMLAVAHEPDDKAYPFEELCRLLRGFPDCAAAINIKSCGLQDMLKSMLNQYTVENYFTFDLSFPDMLANYKHGLTTFTRQSEYEPEPALYERSQGVWLDRFVDKGDNLAVLEGHLNNGKSVAIVSPELHRHAHELFWQRLKDRLKIIKMEKSAISRLYLCTDHPEAAQAFFDA